MPTKMQIVNDKLVISCRVTRCLYNHDNICTHERAKFKRMLDLDDSCIDME